MILVMNRITLEELRLCADRGHRFRKKLWLVETHLLRLGSPTSTMDYQTDYAPLWTLHGMASLAAQSHGSGTGCVIVTVESNFESASSALSSSCRHASGSARPPSATLRAWPRRAWCARAGRCAAAAACAASPRRAARAACAWPRAPLARRSRGWSRARSRPGWG